jgi:hypothetical protein
MSWGKYVRGDLDSPRARYQAVVYLHESFAVESLAVESLAVESLVVESLTVEESVDELR